MSRLTATPALKSQASKFRTRRVANRRLRRQADSAAIHPLLQMQQTHGNRAVGRMIQAQLKVSQPGDKYEQEADRVAEQVVNSPGTTPSQSTAMSGNTQGPSVQRMSEIEDGKNELKKPDEMAIPTISRMPEEEKDKELHKKPVEGKAEEEEMTPNLQTKSAAQASPSVKPSIASNINRMQGGGTHLPKPVRAYFERRMGADFSQVRVHADTQAADTAKSINARAFTVGRNIAFGAGEYSPDTTSGRKLLAHELTHVVQQGGDGVQRKCRDCGVLEEKNKEPVIRTKPKSSVQTFVQRVHIENGRKKFDCPDFAGDTKLEACLNDEDRLHPFDTGASVTRIQTGLQKDGQDLGIDGVKGVYGAATGKAVMAFKQKYNLGSTQFPDVGPGTTKKLDELCVVSPKPPTPKPPSNCGPGTADPFCLGIPSPDAPCKPFPSDEQGLPVWESLRAIVPSGAAATTLCGEVKPVWDTYFAATSIPFAFSSPSSCVVRAAKTDEVGSDTANRTANALLKDILDNLPITLKSITPSPFPVLGPVAERRLPLEEAIAPHGPRFLHPNISYTTVSNAAANIAGGVGLGGQGSDLFGDDDRLINGPVIIEVTSIDPESGRMSGQVRWQPHVHVKDTADFCPGNLGNAFTKEFTIPMSKLEAMGLTRDVPLTIDYDLDVRRADFKNVQLLIGPPPPRKKDSLRGL